MNKNYLFSSESVTEGHPDKMCDIISDAILDAYLEKDPNSRVACEVTVTTGIVTVMGEISSTSTIDITKIVREAVKEIGYEGEDFGFNASTCAVILTIDKQSEDINLGVSSSLEHKKNENICEEHKDIQEEDEKGRVGAGDQGMMFGFACNETKDFMPAPIYYAHKLCYALSTKRKDKVLNYLGPDGKSMVTFEYCDGKPKRIDTIVISTQHRSDITQEEIRDNIIKHIINPVIPKDLIDSETKILINPTGRFVKGGPCSDTGLTGRKIIVDTYGGVGKHGGGAFSGKDPTKVDRTGAYAARYIAKNIVAAKIADRCEIQIAYAIGVANPVSVYVDTFGTSSISNEEITKMIMKLFDLRPGALIEQFEMRAPIYKQLAAYGHFGRSDLHIPWEETNKAEMIKEYFKDGAE